MKSKRNEKSKLQFSFRYIISFDIAEKQTAIYSVVRNKRHKQKTNLSLIRLKYNRDHFGG